MTLYRNYDLRDDIDDVIAVAKEFKYPKAAKLLTDLRDQNKLADLIDWIKKNLTISNPGHNIGNFFYFLNQNEKALRFKILGEHT
jgi:hypothetical protein